MEYDGERIKEEEVEQMIMIMESVNLGSASESEIEEMWKEDIGRMMK